MNNEQTHPYKIVLACDLRVEDASCIQDDSLSTILDSSIIPVWYSLRNEHVVIMNDITEIPWCDCAWATKAVISHNSVASSTKRNKSTGKNVTKKLNFLVLSL